MVLDGRSAGNLPLTPLRDTVVMPGGLVDLFLGRRRSLRAIDAARGGDGRFVAVCQRSRSVEAPCPEDLFETGVVCTIVRVGVEARGSLRVLSEGGEAVRIVRVVDRGDHWAADVLEETLEHGDGARVASLDDRLKCLVGAWIDERCSKLRDLLPQEAEAGTPKRLFRRIVFFFGQTGLPLHPVPPARATAEVFSELGDALRRALQESFPDAYVDASGQPAFPEHLVEGDPAEVAKGLLETWLAEEEKRLRGWYDFVAGLPDASRRCLDVAADLRVPVGKVQAILEAPSVEERVRLVCAMVETRLTAT